MDIRYLWARPDVICDPNRADEAIRSGTGAPFPAAAAIAADECRLDAVQEIA
jgi:hypothetical protein